MRPSAAARAAARKLGMDALAALVRPVRAQRMYEARGRQEARRKRLADATVQMGPNRNGARVIDARDLRPARRAG